MLDLAKMENGELSLMGYNKGDCKMYRRRILSLVIYKKYMGRGECKQIKGSEKWNYPQPKTGHESTLKTLCDL